MYRYVPAGESDFDSDDDDLFEFGDGDNSKFQNAPEKHYQISSPSPGNSIPFCAQKHKTGPHTLALNDLQTAVTVGDLKAVSLLTRDQTDIDVFLSSDWNALMYAAYFAQVEIVRFLIDNNANVNLSNREGVTALHTACKSNIRQKNDGLENIVELLLGGGADETSTDSKGRTPLMYAARGGLSNVVQVFLEHIADKKSLFMKDEKGWSAADWAAVYGHLDVLKLFLDLGITLDSACNSCAMWPESVKEYITTKASMCNKISEEISPIHESADLSEDCMEATAENIFQPSLRPQNDVIKIATFNAGNKNPVEISDTTLDNVADDEIKRNIVQAGVDLLEKESGFFEQPIPNTENCDVMKGKVEETLVAEDEEEELVSILPAMVVREKMEDQAYETYGQLELFLLGLDLARLIPIFKEQDVTFKQLLCLTMEELETIGIPAYGTRKRILSAIRECHEKHTSKSDLPDYTNTALTFDNMVSLISGASEQVAYISSCLKYIRHHIEMYPDAFYPQSNMTYDEPPLQSFSNKLEDMTQSMYDLCKSLKCVKMETEKIRKNTLQSELITPGMEVGPPKIIYGRRSKIKICIGVSLICFLAFSIHNGMVK
uniref:ankyrin repeat, SAM and basic leucine zipper domain-containing protein 1-like n=1 Tax=Styela clava TaxID=7725 RepID=UPI00193966E8|nr:ankyrin repeat, SAM and basic leucine zipper domain-containing protein 1-like [Styela clava]